MKRLLLALGFLCAWTCAAWAGGACLAGCGNWNTATSFSGTTVSATIVAATGDNVRINWCLTANTLTVSGITVAGNAATVGSNNTGTADSYRCGMAYRANVASGTLTVTLTASGTCTGCNIEVENWPGDATTTPLDGQAAAAVAGPGPVPAGSITTTGANDSIESFFYNTNGAGTAPTVPSGYTASVTDTSEGVFTAFKTGNAAGAYNPAWTAISGMFNNYAVTAGWKPLAAGAVLHNRTLTGSGL